MNARMTHTIMKKLYIPFLWVCLFFAFDTTHVMGQSDSTKLADKAPPDAITSATNPSVAKQTPRLQLGGYGEVVMQRMFYSDDANRYRSPEKYENGKHGRFDLPHVVFFLNYNFGRGWKLSTEIEFEHGGVGTAVEIEPDEGGEYEKEVEKGGEVVLEQFWIEKSWEKWANLRMGHIIVPIGLTNMYHMPTEFFTVLRPEEDATIIPCTWHETGISFWGRTTNWRYEALFVSGLDAEGFNNSNWVQGGSLSAYEFKIANTYAGAFRVDNYSVKGLRVGLSGYFGFSASNSLKHSRYEGINGSVSIGTLDFTYNDHNIIARGNFMYGYLGDSYYISMINKKMPSASPSPRTEVASDAMSWYGEIAYDVFSLFPKLKSSGDKLYLFGHYGYYNSMYKTVESKGIQPRGWSEKTILSAGINYYPIKELVIKAEYSLRKFQSPYNNEPTFSIGIGYAGFFK